MLGVRLVVSSVTDLNMSVCSIEKLMLAVNKPRQGIYVFIDLCKSVTWLAYQICSILLFQLRDCLLSRNGKCRLYALDFVEVRVLHSRDIPNQEGALVLGLSDILTGDVIRIHSLQRKYWTPGDSTPVHCIALGFT